MVSLVVVLSGPQTGRGYMMGSNAAALAKAAGIDVEIIEVSSPGKPTAVNAAMRHVWTRFDVAMVLDDDIVVPPQFISASMAVVRSNPGVKFVCALKTALGVSYYEPREWTAHRHLTYLAFLPSTIRFLVNEFPDFFRFAPTGSAYTLRCEGSVFELPPHCNESDLIEASGFALTGLSVGSWFGAEPELEIRRRVRQMVDGDKAPAEIVPNKASRMLYLPRQLGQSLDVKLSSSTGSDLARAVRHTSFIMEEASNARPGHSAIPSVVSAAPVRVEQETISAVTRSHTQGRARERATLIDDYKEPRIPVSEELVFNLHVTERCNYTCKYCFAHWDAADGEEVFLNTKAGVDVIEQIAHATRALVSADKAECRMRFNFVGGEPGLLHNLLDLAAAARRTGARTSIVTNGLAVERFTSESIASSFDVVGLSIDSVSLSTQIDIGRATPRGGTRSLTSHAAAVCALRSANPDILIKVNTVVTNENWQEDMSSMIEAVLPQRWKVFQVLPVQSQLPLAKSRYRAFVTRHSQYSDILVAEDNDLMTDSYLMVDPSGRFFWRSTEVGGGYQYSQPVSSVGGKEALTSVPIVWSKYQERYRVAPV